MDAVDEILRDLFVLRPPREEMLAAVDLRRFAQDDGSALADDLVGGAPQTRIGGDAGPAVGAPALQRHDELGGGDGLALGLVRDRQDPLDGLDPGLDRLLEAAVLLDREDRRLVTIAQPGRINEIGRLIDLAAEAEDHVAADVRMIDDAGHRALQHTKVGRTVVGATATLRPQRDDAVDVGIRLHLLGIAEVLRDPPCG